MMRYFSFKHNLHIPDVGLKLLALERICQEMVKGEPWSLWRKTGVEEGQKLLSDVGGVLELALGAVGSLETSWWL